LKRSIYVLIVIASIAAAIWWWSGSGSDTAETPNMSAGEAPATNHPESRQGLPVVRQGTSDKVEPGPPGQNAMPDVRAQFWASNDYWEFAERVHEAAKRGDGASQYYLSVALYTCEYFYRFYFIEQRSGAPPRIRTLDEAQQLTATRRGSAYTPQDVQKFQVQCQRIINAKPPPFGDADKWMDAAMASGYPLAQVRAAEQKALQALKNPTSEGSRIARSEARALVVEALRTKDAEVVLTLASTAAFLTGDVPGEVGKRQWTWVMAAYQLDPNSNSLVEWAKEVCRYDIQCHPDEKIIDVIRRTAGNDLDEVERRARALNEKIDAGTFDESDI